MKTTVEKVYVELIDNGKVKLRAFPIRTPGGELMTHRLKRLIDGKIQRSYSAWSDIHGDNYDSAHIFVQHDIRYVGMVWKQPCVLLQEIAHDRAELQHELYLLEGENDLSSAQLAPIPPAATNLDVSLAIWRELELRRAIKRRIRELDRTKALRDTEAASSDFTCSAWELDSTCAGASSSGDELEKPQLPNIPTPYSW